MAKELNLLSNPEEKLLVQITAIRNRFTHVAKNIGMDLPTYVAGLDPNDYAQLKDSLGFTGIETIKLLKEDVSTEWLVREATKAPIIIRAAVCLIGMFMHIKQKAELAALKELLEEYSNKESSDLFDALIGRAEKGKGMP